MYRLKQLREQKGFTQKQLAGMLGVCTHTISCWECGTKTPSIKKLKQITEILDCKIDDIV